MGKKVIAAGHICLDITPVFGGKKAKQLGDILTPGKLVHVGEADVHTGGSVANTGLAMKILGADVSLMGKVGDDVFGRIVCDVLRAYDADGGMLVSGEESTSYTVALAVPGIDRVFLHNPGANHTFRAADIPQEKLEEAALFHFGYPPIMRSMYERDGAELIAMMRRAKACGAATSLDFAAIDPDSEAGQVDWRYILEQVIPYVDILVPSVEELCFMLDRERFQEWQERADGKDITEILDVEKDVVPVARQCMDFGATILLIKCGAPGIYYRTGSQQVLSEIGAKLELDTAAWADQAGFEASYVPEKVLSGTGAGDTSIAAFLTAILEGYPPEMAMHLAAATGACCVEAYDALGGLKPLEELERKIAQGWKKNNGH